MTEAMWIVSALTGLAVGLILLILNDHRSQQKETKERMDKLEKESGQRFEAGAMEAHRQDIEAARVRLDGFTRLAQVETAIEAFTARLSETRIELKEALVDFRTENRQRHDRHDGRFDKLESEVRKLNGKT